jgi:hypothetical protein
MKRAAPYFAFALLAPCVLFAAKAHAAPPESAAPRRELPAPRVAASTKTSLVWILGDDDLTHAPSETSPPSPAPSLGDRPGYDGLFEGASSRYTGRENRLEFRLAGEALGFHPAVSTRAELALGLDASTLGEAEGSVRLEDAGSHLELVVRFVPTSKRYASNGLGFRLYPLDGDRERLGDAEALGVGGEVGPARESPYARATSPVRAGTFWLELARVRAFVTLKTAAFLEPVPGAPPVEETSYAVFGGVESRWQRLVAFGFGFGYFEFGRLPSASRPLPRATTAVASARVSLARGVRRPLAPASFGSEPPPFDPARDGEDQAPGFAFGVEGSHILQNLVDFERSGETALAGARAFALLGTARTSALELRLALYARDAGFVMRNALGVLPGQTTPDAARELAELSALGSARYRPFEPLAFTLGLGVRRPVAVLTRAFDAFGQPSGATLLLHGPNETTLLPAGETPVPVFDVRPQVEARLSRLLELVSWVGYRRDFNQTRLVPNAEGSLSRAFADPDRVSFGVAARAVW